MAITDRNVSTGTKLWARYKGEVHTAEVVETEGKQAFRLEGGREFKSPSAAGTAITGKACNGWAFWSVGEPTEKAPKAEKPARTVNPVPKPERKARARKEKDIPRAENGEALPIVEQTDGNWECGECGASFPTSDEGWIELKLVDLRDQRVLWTGKVETVVHNPTAMRAAVAGLLEPFREHHRD